MRGGCAACGGSAVAVRRRRTKGLATASWWTFLSGGARGGPRTCKNVRIRPRGLRPHGCGGDGRRDAGRAAMRARRTQVAVEGDREEGSGSARRRPSALGWSWCGPRAGAQAAVGRASGLAARRRMRGAGNVRAQRPSGYRPLGLDRRVNPTTTMAHSSLSPPAGPPPHTHYDRTTSTTTAVIRNFQGLEPSGGPGGGPRCAGTPPPPPWLVPLTGPPNTPTPPLCHQHQRTLPLTRHTAVPRTLGGSVGGSK